MNPLGSIPARVRLVLYIVYALLGPVLIYCSTRGWTGEAEYALYVGVGTALGLTAASNIHEEGGAYEPHIIPGTTLPGLAQGEPFDPDNRPTTFGN